MPASASQGSTTPRVTATSSDIHPLQGDEAPALTTSYSNAPRADMYRALIHAKATNAVDSGRYHTDRQTRMFHDRHPEARIRDRRHHPDDTYRATNETVPRAPRSGDALDLVHNPTRTDDPARNRPGRDAALEANTHAEAAFMHIDIPCATICFRAQPEQSAASRSPSGACNRLKRARWSRLIRAYQPMIKRSRIHTRKVSPFLD